MQTSKSYSNMFLMVGGRLLDLKTVTICKSVGSQDLISLIADQMNRNDDGIIPEYRSVGRLEFLSAWTERHRQLF